MASEENQGSLSGGAGSTAEELHSVIHQVLAKELGKRPESMPKESSGEWAVRSPWKLGNTTQGLRHWGPQYHLRNGYP